MFERKPVDQDDITAQGITLRVCVRRDTEMQEYYCWDINECEPQDDEIRLFPSIGKAVEDLAWDKVNHIVRDYNKNLINKEEKKEKKWSDSLDAKEHFSGHNNS